MFAFFVALPAVALAVAGLRAISADEIARADALRRRAQLFARDSDDSLLVALENTRLSSATELSAGMTPFRSDMDGTLSFPRDRVFVAEFGIVPTSLSADTGAGSPGAIPRAIMSASSTRSPAVQADALKQLRAGTWWLHLDQRRAYDREIANRLIAAGTQSIEREDRRLDELGHIQSLLASYVRVDPAGRTAAATPAGPALIVSGRRNNNGSLVGVVLDAATTQALIQEALRSVLQDDSFGAEIVDGRGTRVWPSANGQAGELIVEQPLSSIDGWRLRISHARRDHSGRSPWVYGLVVLPIAVLAFGLLMTSRVVRREVELTRRQAEFTAAVTHEFKSPITSLRLLMERISSGRVNSSATLAEYHESITREINRLDGLVNRLLDVQQIQAGKRSHLPAPVSVAQLVADSVDRFRQQATVKGITLRGHVPETVADLPLDRHSISDALDNLIDNAIKYSASGTSVIVTSAVENGQLSLEVRDQGAGIHEQDLPHIFEPYYRGRLGDRESVRGTGLGLVLVHAAAAAHGGAVDVTSAPGKGSSFTLRIPVRGLS